MVDFNPNFPDVLGLEWLVTRYQSNRVWAGAPPRVQRLRSTTTETINGLHMSATVDPLSRASVPTVVDIIEEGSESTPAFEPVELLPSADVAIANWRTHTGSSSNLFQQIDEDATRWPGPAQNSWIQNTVGNENYDCRVNASDFAGGGPLQNARIGFVEIRGILGANTGFRKIRTSIVINGTQYNPAGGGLRDAHGFGAPYIFWWGELNPATERPWTPADIADFGSGGNSFLRVRCASATPSHFPKVNALRLWVYCIPVDNRVAVGVWRRPENMSGSLQNVQTDALRTVPSGASGWSKQSGRNYLFNWRQSISPALYGAVVADDVRWNGLYQDLGPAGEPPGIVFPLHHSGVPPAPSTGLASAPLSVDQFGGLLKSFPADSRATYGLALRRSDAAMSVDSQPYRLAKEDIAILTTQSIGQRVVPGSTQSYLGVRIPIVPTARTATGNAVLRVRVHRVSDNVQIGGTFEISESAARALPAGATVAGVEGIGGIRYVSGFLSSGATLQSGTAYEIRVTTTGGKWLAFMPDASLAPTRSFGGNTNGAFIGGTHQPNRDLVVNLIRQPDPPTSVVAAIDIQEVTMPDGSTREIDRVSITWNAPAVGLGGSFSRYELERRLEDETEWTRVAHLNGSSLLSFLDHQAPRQIEATYRVRAVALDGRISNWATSNAITPDEGDYDIALTSNHSPELTVVLDSDPEASYEFLSSGKKETVAIAGADYQVVFKEKEDRGVAWRAGVELNFGNEPPVVRAGQRVFTPLLDITETSDIPHVAVMDFQGTRVLGDVTPSDAVQQQPGHRYKATISVIPTHTREVPVEVFP